jgi:hypothetical protein
MDLQVQQHGLFRRLAHIPFTQLVVALAIPEQTTMETIMALAVGQDTTPLQQPH